MNSPSKVVLAYSIAIAVLSLSGIIAFIYVDNFLQGKPEYITPYFNPWISYSPTASPNLIFAYQFTAIMSFVSMWIATIFLTSRYASKSKKIRYWTIVSIPHCILCKLLPNTTSTTTRFAWAIRDRGHSYICLFVQLLIKYSKSRRWDNVWYCIFPTL